jgi:cell division protein FtsN
MGNRASSRAMLGAAIAALIVAGCSHEAADWKSATLANTSEAYQSFLQQYPHSREATEAQARIKQLTEERDWQNAVAANTRDAYQQFTTQHPDSKNAQEAKIRIENFAQADLGAAATANAGVSTPPVSSPSAASSAPEVTETTSLPVHSVHKPRTAQLAADKHVSRVSTAHASASSQWVQLGAFGSKSRAESHWRQLAARFSALKSLHPHYVAVRSHQHHVYRLEVRVSSAAVASGLCATLKRHAQACMRVNA